MKSIFLSRFRFQRWRRFIEKQVDTMESAGGLELDEDETENAEFEQEYQAYLDSEPVLDPRRTMLFYTQKGENQCNELHKKRFQTYILWVSHWAIEHGINHFIVDPTSPFGLLALEMLLDLRTKGEQFHLYAFQSVPPSQRKSYRLLPETEIEYLMLLARTDYRYRVHLGHTVQGIFETAGTYCTECGIWVSKQRVPAYLQEAWAMLA